MAAWTGLAYNAGARNINFVGGNGRESDLVFTAATHNVPAGYGFRIVLDKTNQTDTNGKLSFVFDTLAEALTATRTPSWWTTLQHCGGAERRSHTRRRYFPT